jgi:hypothetical protein
LILALFLTLVPAQVSPHDAVAAASRPGAAVSTQDGAAASRQERFVELLRTYPDRPPAQTFREVAALVDEGPFEEHDRAEYWIGNARLVSGDRAGARAWFARLWRDHPDSVWTERSWLGMGDAAAFERDYGAALQWYGHAARSRDAAVRELSQIDVKQARVLQRRQRLAWLGGALSLLIAVVFFVQGFRRLWPLPAETRIVLPVLAVLAVLSTRIDPAPRTAVLTLVLGGAALSVLSGARLAAARRNRFLHACLGLVCLAGLGFVAVYRADLVGMLLETFRTGPE